MGWVGVLYPHPSLRGPKISFGAVVSEICVCAPLPYPKLLSLAQSSVYILVGSHGGVMARVVPLS